MALLEVLGVLSCYVITLGVGSTRSGLVRMRVIVSYLYVVWFYCAVARITPALGSPMRDRLLLSFDEGLFRKTPAIYCERIAAAWITDLLSICYLTYHLYLAMAALEAVRNVKGASRRLSPYVSAGFVIGLAGYLLVPAIGPAYAFPNLFQAPLPQGTIGTLIDRLVTSGSSRYDVFPSLHVLITCILLDHDWRFMRWRFLVMIGPAFGLTLSTIYLRYHYGVDILAALAIFLALRQTFLKVWAREITLGDEVRSGNR